MIVFPWLVAFPWPEGTSVRGNTNWAAINGGVRNGGLRGVWPPFLEIGRNRPFSPFFCLFRPFPEGAKSTREIQKTEEKGFFPQISSDLLKPPSLKPPFAALQTKAFLRKLFREPFGSWTSAPKILDVKASEHKSEVSTRGWRTEGVGGQRGLADREGWREEILHMPNIQASFLCPFSYAFLGEGGHIFGELFGVFLGACLSPTPSRQTLFETSE